MYGFGDNVGDVVVHGVGGVGGVVGVGGGVSGVGACGDGGAAAGSVGVEAKSHYPMIIMQMVLALLALLVRCR